METYLRHFVLDRQDDWVQLLPLAELYFNSSVSSSTGFSPFFAQYSFHPRTNMFHNGLYVPAADQLLDSLISVHNILKDNLIKAEEFQHKYFDQRTQDPPVYEAGDWVWLLRQNIPTTCPSSKLDFKRLGPFRVDLPMGSDLYRLVLPRSLSRTHPVFHTSLLLPFVDPDSFPHQIGSKAPRGPFSLKQKFWDKTNVEAILGHRSPTKTTHEYLVRWRGGSAADNSWEQGGCFSPSLHPYMEQFHDLHGAKVILSPDEAVLIPF
jgi:hypothetical protein